MKSGTAPQTLPGEYEPAALNPVVPHAGIALHLPEAEAELHGVIVGLPTPPESPSSAGPVGAKLCPSCERPNIAPSLDVKGVPGVVVGRPVSLD